MSHPPVFRPLWKVTVAGAELAHRFRLPKAPMPRGLLHAPSSLLKDPAGREAVRGVVARHLGISRPDLIRMGSAGLVAGQVWLEVPMGDGAWVAAARFVIHEGQPVVAEVRVFPNTRAWHNEPGEWDAEVLGVAASAPQGGLSARLLRRVRLGDHPRYTRKILADIAQREGGREWFAPDRSLGALGLTAPEAERPRPRRERGLSDLFFAQLAMQYAEVCEGPRSRQAVKVIADRRGATKEKIRQLVREARVRGLLTMGTQGKAGGVPTERALTLLRTVQREAERKGGTRKRRSTNIKKGPHRRRRKSR